MTRGKFLSLFGFIVFGFLFSTFCARGAYAATYYVRADGTVTAVNKANATSPASAGTALNMAQVKLATFAAGDQVLFSSQGGAYTEGLVLPSGGSSSGNEISYSNVPSETPAISTSDASIIDTNSKSNVKVVGFSVTYTGTSNVASGIIINGNGAANITINSNTVNMGGYGYGIISGANNLANVYLDGNSVSNVGSTRYTLYLYGTGTNNVSILNHTVTENAMGSNIKNVTNLTINGFSGSGSTSNSMLIIDTCAGSLSVTDVTLSNTSGYGIAVKSSNLSTGSTITRAAVTNSTSYGYHLMNTNNLTISESSYSGTGVFGFYVYGGCQNIQFIHDTSDGLGSGGGFTVQDSSDVSYTDCTAVNGGGFIAKTNTGSTNNISYLRCHSGSQSKPNNTSGFEASGSATNITYTSCTADYNAHLGFVVANSVSNVTYQKCYASYNGTINDPTV